MSWPSLHLIAVLIEAVGSLYIVGAALSALLVLGSGRAAERLGRARLLIAEGALAALNFKVAATLLNTLQLHTWHQIGVFVATFALRTALKRMFTWEQAQLRCQLSTPERPQIPAF